MNIQNIEKLKIIFDVIYYSNNHPMIKIGQLRPCTEYLVRFALNMPEGEYLTLGSKKINKSLKAIGYTDDEFWKAYDTINHNGRDNLHTQSQTVPNINELNECLTAFNILIIHLFISFFNKFPFGDNSSIISHFSLLPPLLRHDVLKRLYKSGKYNDNLVFIEKYALSQLKAFNREKALKWLKTLVILKNKAFPKELNFNITHYDILEKKINDVNEILTENGHPYTNFEEARHYYEEVGILQGDSEDILAFNALMNFIYIGRQIDTQKRPKNLGNYIQATISNAINEREDDYKV